MPFKIRNTQRRDVAKRQAVKANSLKNSFPLYSWLRQGVS
jgi:hypothetical protein